MLSVGLVGLANVGKSTLFNALANQNVLVADYPFATIKPTVGTVAITDQRVVKLAQLCQSAKTTFATVSFVDIAGLVAGASQGQGLGNAFLAHIRQTSLIAQVVRLFTTTGSPQPPTPQADIDIIATELILADWQSLAKQAHRLVKPAQTDPKIKAKLELINRAQAELKAGQPLRNSLDCDHYRHHLKDSNLLTLKPIIYVFNSDSSDLVSCQSLIADLKLKHRHLILNAKLELEISQLPAADQPDFLAAYQLPQSGVTSLSQLGFKQLGLITYLTVGAREARAWTIKSGWLAPQAAGVIHTDFKTGFIAAEVANYQDFLKTGSWIKARQAGLVRVEGRNYQVAEADVINFRFNV